MLLINCEINLILTRSSICPITISTGAGTFNKTDTRLDVPMVPLPTQDKAKRLQQLKSSFKRTIKWSKYQSKASITRSDQY